MRAAGVSVRPLHAAAAASPCVRRCVRAHLPIHPTAAAPISQHPNTHPLCPLRQQTSHRPLGRSEDPEPAWFKGSTPIHPPGGVRPWILPRGTAQGTHAQNESATPTSRPRYPMKPSALPPDDFVSPIAVPDTTVLVQAMSSAGLRNILRLPAPLCWLRGCVPERCNPGSRLAWAFVPVFAPRCDTSCSVTQQPDLGHVCQLTSAAKMSAMALKFVPGTNRLFIMEINT